MPYDSVNLVVRKWAYNKFYFITVFWGIMTSHLFLGSTATWLDCREIGITFSCDVFNVLVVAGISILLLIIGLFNKRTLKLKAQIILFIVGMVIGHFVWSMNNYPLSS